MPCKYHIGREVCDVSMMCTNVNECVDVFPSCDLPADDLQQKCNGNGIRDRHKQHQ